MEGRMLWRGKRLDGGEWVQGYPSCFTKGGYHLQEDIIYSIMIPVKLGDGRIALTGIRTVDPATLGACTGLRDKNGTLIFEGDKLVFSSFDFCRTRHPETGVVVFSQCEFIIRPHTSDIISASELQRIYGLYDVFCDDCDIEITGTIHD